MDAGTLTESENQTFALVAVGAGAVIQEGELDGKVDCGEPPWIVTPFGRVSVEFDAACSFISSMSIHVRHIAFPCKGESPPLTRLLSNDPKFL